MLWHLASFLAGCVVTGAAAWGLHRRAMRASSRAMLDDTRRYLQAENAKMAATIAAQIGRGGRPGESLYG